jgi:hypothetical protein
MTDRERMLAAMRGEAVDRIPWVPRLEFWYRARRRLGILPAGLRSLSLLEITERLGVGHYAVIPDFTDCPGDLDMVDRGLGLLRLPVLPYQTCLEGVERRVTRREKETVVEYHTPVGSLRTTTIFTEEMLDAGASVPWISEHAIREPGHFEVLRYIFSRIRVEPQSEGYLALRRRVGDRGLVIGYASGTACPMQHIMKELMPLDQFFYALHDHPEKVEGLEEAMQPYYRQIQECAANSPAEAVLLGGNYDDSITFPRFFRQHILPPLREYAAFLHGKNKLLITHTDGENRGLMPLYLEAGFDVADSVCPHPMTSLRLEEFLEAFAGRIAVMGGIPAILLCKDSASLVDCLSFVDRTLEHYGRQTRFILGVSDMVTADAEWDRLQYITSRVQNQ